MARQSIYELRLIAALSLRGNEAGRDELARVLGREGYLNEAARRLAAAGAVVEDREQQIFRLLPGRAAELLGLCRVPVKQQEMFHEGCLLPPKMERGGTGSPGERTRPGADGQSWNLSPGETPPAKEGWRITGEHPVHKPVVGATHGGGRHPQAHHTHEVLEISTSDLMSSGAALVGTQLNRNARARAEQASTERARAVSARYRHDDYVMAKLATRRAMREELLDGETPTARKFAVLYARNPDRARELLGAAVQVQPNPAGYLNVRLRAEGVRY